MREVKSYEFKITKPVIQSTKQQSSRYLLTSERIHVGEPIKYAQRIVMTHLQFIDDKELQNECRIYI